MWNSLFFNHIKLLLRNTAFRRLALALALSLLLHAFFIHKLYIAQPDVNKNVNQVMLAELVKPDKLITPPPAVVIAPKEIVLQPKKSAKLAELAPIKNLNNLNTPAGVSDTSKESTVEEINYIDNGITNTPEMENAQINQEQVPDIETADSQSGLEQAMVEDENQPAFKYVEMHFAVFTDKELTSGGSSVGDASMVYEQVPETQQYKISSTVHAKGLASLFVPDLLQISQGNITEKGLQPTYYLYQFGDKKNKTYQADFDWPAGQLHLHNVKADKTLPLAEGTQDLLSFMYQFMFVQPMQTMQLSITNGKKIGVYTYAFEGEETLDSRMGALNTIHLSRASSENDKKTELWLALDYQYVPVKIRETDKDGKVYELLVTTLKTSQ